MLSGSPPQRRPGLALGVVALLCSAPFLPGACSNSDLGAYSGGEPGGGAGSGGAPAGAGGAGGRAGQAGQAGKGASAGGGAGGGAGAAGMTLRPVAPLSTATVTTRRPTLRWALPPGVSKVRVELFLDRACTRALTAFDVSGSSGAAAMDLPAGVVFWRITSVPGALMAAQTSAVWQFTVGHRSAPVDTSWGSALDVNGDGFADVVVGAPTALGGGGEALVFLGAASGIGAAPAATLKGPDGGEFGAWLSSAGDVNGDGFADLVVGAAGTSTSTGKAYLYLGGAAGLSPAPALTWSGSEANGQFGFSVAGAGDVNGDGYGDLLVGASGVSLGAGKAYLYLGGPAGPSAMASVTLAGTQSGDAFGYAVASAGDMNGDGFGDVVIAAVGAGSAQLGEVYVYLGSAAGLGAPAVLGGIDPMSFFGATVGSAGDLNGDGYGDLVVSADTTSGSTGKAFVYMGGPSGVAPAPVAMLAGTEAGSHFGAAVAGAGDLNGDGFGDLAVGAPAAAGAAGRVFLYLGSPAGISSTSLTLSGAEGGGAFGAFALGAGDVNGDGFADLAVGADSAGAGAGAALLFAGSTAGVSVAPTTLSGPEPNGHFGACLASFGARGRRGPG